MSVTGHLVRPTQGSNEAGRLLPFYLVLLRVGFTKLPPSPAALVSSYLTFSPLPSAIARGLGGVFFCGTFLGIASTGRYPAPCPVELGLSSDARWGARDRLYSSTPYLPPYNNPNRARVQADYAFPSSSSLASSSARVFSSRGTCETVTRSNAAIISRVRSKRGLSVGCLTLY